MVLHYIKCYWVLLDGFGLNWMVLDGVELIYITIGWFQIIKWMDGMSWNGVDGSPGGCRYRAPYSANKKQHLNKFVP